MLDPMICRRPGFRAGIAVRLADGLPWILPDADQAQADGTVPAYNDLVGAVSEADRPTDLLRAELALGIYLIAQNYELPPLILGALLDFPQNDPHLALLQADLHAVALDHVRAFRPQSNQLLKSPRLPRRFGLLRTRASMSA